MGWNTDGEGEGEIGVALREPSSVDQMDGYAVSLRLEMQENLQHGCLFKTLLVPCFLGSYSGCHRVSVGKIHTEASGSGIWQRCGDEMSHRVLCFFPPSISAQYQPSAQGVKPSRGR